MKNGAIIGVIPQYPYHSQQNIYGKIKMAPIGIVSVLSQIEVDSGFSDVYAVDENNYRGPRDFRGMPDHSFLQERSPASVAMFYGGMSNSIPRMFSVAKQYKSFGSLTIAGGSHVDALPEDALNSGIDVVVHGEGEHITREVLETIVSKDNNEFDKEKLAQISGISFLNNNGDYVFTGRREALRSLNELKDPDLTLIKFLDKRWSAIPISRGRGCNWKCEFCTVNQLYGKYKSESNEKVLRQIIKYSDMGYRSFFFTDDNFAQNPKQTIELCSDIGDYRREFNKKLNLFVQVRNEVAENPRLIDAMKLAGVKMLCIGYESPINEDLKAMNKGVTVEKLIERSRKLSKDFYLHGMFIFGYPTFKDSEIKSELTLEQKAKRYNDFFKKAKIDTVQVLNAIPLPGTLLRDKLEAEGRVLPLETVGWDRYDGLHLCYDSRPEGIDMYDLQNIPRTLMKKWYLGNAFERGLNPINWMTWTYNATIGFPIQFGTFYAKRFVHNLAQKSRGESMENDSFAQKKNIFQDSCAHAMDDIKRKWRNLTIRTYGGGIVKKWYKEYEKGEYSSRMKDFFTKKK